jgi:hypothetical protein
VPITKQGTPKFITEVHYILATISLKFRARITKFQGDVPEALEHGISLVRLVICTDHAKLAAAERISECELRTTSNSCLDHAYFFQPYGESYCLVSVQNRVVSLCYNCDLRSGTIIFLGLCETCKKAKYELGVTV